MSEIKGGCLCGQVRYRADGEPRFVGVCHCTDCQKFSGSPFSTVIGMSRSSVEVSGTLKTFTKNGSSGQPIHRHFCPECGSSVMDEADALAGIAMIGTGTLDDPSWVRPGAEIFCDSAQPWVELGGEMQRFSGAPVKG